MTLSTIPFFSRLNIFTVIIAQSAGAVEYTDFNSAEG